MKKTVSIFLTFMLTLSLAALPVQTALGAQWLAGHDLENLAPPLPPPSMPTIKLITEIPHGLTHLLRIDIEYLAEPSEGAHIHRVWLHRGNDTTGSIIYLSEKALSASSARGTLGKATIHIREDGKEEQLSLRVEDSAGLTATYVIENIPYREGIDIFPPPRIPLEDFVFCDYESFLYVPNRLKVFTVSRNYIPDIEIYAEAFASIQGEIIGYWFDFGWFDLQVPPSDTDGLYEMGDYLLETYPHLFNEFGLEWGSNPYRLREIHPDIFDEFAEAWGVDTREGGGFFNSGIPGGSFRNWAFGTIDLLRAWAVFGAQERN